MKKTKKLVFFVQHLGGCGSICKTSFMIVQWGQPKQVKHLAKPTQCVTTWAGLGPGAWPQVHSRRDLNESTGPGIRLAGSEFWLYHLEA